MGLRLNSHEQPETVADAPLGSGPPYLVKELPVHEERVVWLDQLTRQKGEEPAHLGRGKVLVVHHHLEDQSMNMMSYEPSSTAFTVRLLNSLENTVKVKVTTSSFRQLKLNILNSYLWFPSLILTLIRTKKPTSAFLLTSIQLLNS